MGPLASQSGSAAAFPDSAAVTAGERYGAGASKTALLGDSYRKLWTTPIRVRVLDPDTLGGLTPIGLGGGNQTVSLELSAGNGREYRFRLVDKVAGQQWPDDLRGTVLHDLYQDQISSLHPGSALMVDELLDALGVLHTEPGLFVLPDHPFLGEFRDRFTGRLGLFEERPDENAGAQSAFAAADEVEGSEDFLDALEDSAVHRLDSRDYLTARLVDLLVGDWDRHGDQWRWARFEQPDGRHLWRPVPRDRDYAFADYDGWLLKVLSQMYPQAQPYGPRYRGTIPGLTQNAWVLDHRLLAGLPWADWDSVAEHIRSTLTDSVLGRAFGRLPAEYQEASSPEFERILRGRRDRISQAARAFYDRLAVAPTLHATDDPNWARVERHADGRVSVRVWVGDEPAGDAYLSRVFLPAETEEVRLYLRGGGDVAVVEGTGGPIALRIIGGDGDDRLVDRSSGPGTIFYDEDGNDELVLGRKTRVDRRRYDRPEPKLEAALRHPRDWGSEFSLFSPSADWRPFAGPVVGGGPKWTRYGFRREPWASVQTVRALWAPLHPTRFAAEYRGRFRPMASDLVAELLARASSIEATAYYGLGNETEAAGNSEDHVIWEQQLLIRPRLLIPIGTVSTLVLGGELRHSDPSGTPPDATSDLGPFGAGAFNALGASGALQVERVDDAASPRRGVRGGIAAEVYPAVLDEERSTAGPFGEASGALMAYLSPLPGGPTLALRVGAERLWGDFPYPYAAFVGGSETLRGYARQRFAGDAAAYGTAELRQVLTRAELIVRGDLGVFGLADTGRVWRRGESAGGWHQAFGGGLFFDTIGRSIRVSVAQGDETMVYLQLNSPF